jgi:hypothetical protein
MAGLQYRKVIGVLIAGSMVFSSTGAIAAAAPAPVTQPDPWAVLSFMSGGASAAAVCGAAAAAAAAAQPAAGCVLPQVDVAAPAAAPPAPVPVPPVEPASAGLGISPLLIGLAAIAAGVALFFVLRHHHHNNSPM